MDAIMKIESGVTAAPDFESLPECSGVGDLARSCGHGDGGGDFVLLQGSFQSLADSRARGSGPSRPRAGHHD
jgi:hypothetical protein